MTDDLRPASARPARSIRLPRVAATALVLAFAAGCSTAPDPSASPGSSGGRTAPPTPGATPVADGIDHPTGATDILLRMETGGGFVPLEFMVTNAPTFTLYGDGTIVFRDPTATPPEEVGGVRRSVPFQTVRAGEEGIQALLEEALGPGGLGIAVGPYIGHGADIPTTTFTITADGRAKQVSISGLLPEGHPQDAVIVASLARLAERLDGFATDIAGEQAYVPTAYRGVLMPVDQPFGPVIAWPWSDIEPADFVSGENEFFTTRTMTPAEIGELGIPGIDGGFQGLFFQTEGKVYSFALRPLLPDETK